MADEHLESRTKRSVHFKAQLAARELRTIQRERGLFLILKEKKNIPNCSEGVTNTNAFEYFETARCFHATRSL